MYNLGKTILLLNRITVSVEETGKTILSEISESDHLCEIELFFLECRTKILGILKHLGSLEEGLA